MSNVKVKDVQDLQELALKYNQLAKELNELEALGLKRLAQEQLKLTQQLDPSEYAARKRQLDYVAHQLPKKPQYIILN